MRKYAQRRWLLAWARLSSGQLTRNEPHHFIQSRIGPDLACLRIADADSVNDFVAVQEAASLDRLPVDELANCYV